MEDEASRQFRRNFEAQFHRDRESFDVIPKRQSL